MGLFNCCIKQQVLLEEQLQRISHGTDARPPPEVMQQTTQTDQELLSDLLEQEAREMIVSGPIQDSTKVALEGGQEKPVTHEKSQDMSVAGTTSEKAPLRCMSARDVERLHSGASRTSSDADAGSRRSTPDAPQQESVETAVRKVFLEYARFGSRGKNAKTLDVYRFMKLIRECSLMTNPDSAAAVDLIFCKGRTLCAVRKTPMSDHSASMNEAMPARSRQPGHCFIDSKSERVKGSRMDFQAFLGALQQVAELLGVPEADVRHAVASSRGPLVNAVTLPRFMRLHDGASAGAKPSASAKQEAENEQVMELASGTYAKGMIKSGPTTYGTSGFAPKASARPGSPCFAAITAAGKPPGPPKP